MLGDDITEVGAMNVFFLLQDATDKKKKVLVTPPLYRGDILPGVTRRSILEIVSTWPNISVQERNISLTEVTEAFQDGRVLEVFGAGTAAVVSPICGIDEMDIHAPGEFTLKIWKELIDIQYGRKDHPGNWIVEV
jgi:branched-chain amino acid aminotransferase